MACKVCQCAADRRIIAMSFKVEVEDIFPGALARWTRFELEQVDVVCSQNAQALIKRARLMGSGHDQHRLCLSFATRHRLSTQCNETGVVILDGLNTMREDVQLIQFTCSCSGDRGYPLQVLLAHHFSAARGVIGRHNFETEFAQVGITLRKCLWM